MTKKRVAIFGAFFVLGALPLLVYNIDSDWATFRGNVQRDPNGLAGKARFLIGTAGGQGLFGWLTFEDWQTKSPHTPDTPVARASARISELAGQPRQHYLLYAVILAILIAPFGGWQTLRLVLFALIVLAVAWFQMAINANTGGSVHHTVLLWPLPQFIVAVSFASVSQRLGRLGLPIVATVVAALVIPAMLVINEYYTVARRNGGAQAWTDAATNLTEYVKTLQAKTVVCMDWGFCDQLRLFGAGKFPLATGSDQMAKAELSADDRQIVNRMLDEPANFYILHTKDFAFFPEWGERFLVYAKDAGYQEDLVRTVPDNYGRDVYRVYKFRKLVSSN